MVGGGFLEHLLESLPCRLAEQAEVFWVVFENGTQELGDGEDELSMADVFENVGIEPLGKKQDALLLARGTKQPAFAGIGEDGLIAAVVAPETRKPSVQISAIQILAHDLADDGSPAAILLLISFTVDPLRLLVIVFHQRIERTGMRVARLIDSCRDGLHTLHNRQGPGMSEKKRACNPKIEACA
jgi:hypothetical protein